MGLNLGNIAAEKICNQMTFFSDNIYTVSKKNTPGLTSCNLART